MKKLVQITFVISVMAFGSSAFANPKCSHRLASNGNDLFKNTNPIKAVTAKEASTKSNNDRSSTRSGVR